MRRVQLFNTPVSCFFATFSFVSFVGLISIMTLYFSHFNASKHDLRIEANQIESTLCEILSQTNQLMFHLGKQVSSLGTHDIEAIASIIRRDKDESFKIVNPLRWMNFGWINPDNKTFFDWHSGVCQTSSVTPPFLLSKNHVRDPWKLHVSRAIFACGLREIPGVMGITDDKGVYLGSLSVGFGIAEINNKIQTALRNSQVIANL
jgi:hypothetical protein